MKELTQKQVNKEILKREHIQTEILEKYGDLVEVKKKELCPNCVREGACLNEWKLLPVNTEGKDCIYFGAK
jgi:hypothetical protein